MGSGFGVPVDEPVDKFRTLTNPSGLVSSLDFGKRRKLVGPPILSYFSLISPHTSKLVGQYTPQPGRAFNVGVFGSASWASRISALSASALSTPAGTFSRSERIWPGTISLFGSAVGCHSSSPCGLRSSSATWLTSYPSAPGGVGMPHWANGPSTSCCADVAPVIEASMLVAEPEVSDGSTAD